MMIDWNNITFADPEYFWLFLLLPLGIYWYISRYKKSHSFFHLPSLHFLPKGLSNWRVRLRPLPFIFKLLAFSTLLLAMARPQSTLKEEEITTEAIDIVLTIDISGSMLAEDFKPNRIEAAKNVALEFIEDRREDRIGLVVFAGESFTQVPLTTDHSVIKSLLMEIKSGMIEEGTAIGMGMATAVNRLKETKAESKVIILLTDGVNNAGFIDPLTAAEIASQYDIRIYTIGVGTIGFAPYPVKTPFGTQYQQMKVRIDEELLKKIADMTGGEYFRATNNEALKEVYDQIDKLEKTKIEVTTITRESEEFYPFAILAGIFLLADILLRYTVLRSIT